MIDPNKVMVCVPCLSGDICCETAQGLIQSGGLYHGCMFLPGCSEVNLIRNLAVAQFLKSLYDWLVFIDADIGFDRQDFEYLCDGNEKAVYSPYSKKDGSQQPAEFGLGFARIHRSVFEYLISMDADGNTGDDAGDPAVNFFTWRGEMVYELFPSFATASHHWSGEDHSFWKLVQLAKFTPRKELRPRLRHYGRAAFMLPENELPFAANAPAIDIVNHKASCESELVKVRCPKLVRVGDAEYQCDHVKGHAGVCVAGY